MADFREEMYIQQIDDITYSWAWRKLDLAFEDDQEIDFDYEQECSSEELLEILEAYNFDTDKVFNHFEDYPFSSITLVDEY